MIRTMPDVWAPTKTKARQCQFADLLGVTLDPHAAVLGQGLGLFLAHCCRAIPVGCLIAQSATRTPVFQ